MHLFPPVILYRIFSNTHRFGIFKALDHREIIFDDIDGNKLNESVSCEGHACAF